MNLVHFELEKSQKKKQKNKTKQNKTKQNKTKKNKQTKTKKNFCLEISFFFSNSFVDPPYDEKNNSVNNNSPDS